MISPLQPQWNFLNHVVDDDAVNDDNVVDEEVVAANDVNNIIDDNVVALHGDDIFVVDRDSAKFRVFFERLRELAG